MAKLLIASILILGLVGLVRMDGPNMQQGGNMMPPMQPMQGQGQGQGNMLSNIMSIPQRAMQMIGGVLTNVRNMLPNLGRNTNGGQQQNRPNIPNPLNMLNNGSGQNSNGLNLPDLNNLARPLQDSLQGLQQGQLPNVNQLTQGLTKTVSDLSGNLIPSSQGGNSPLNGLLGGGSSGNGQGVLGGLSNTLNGLTGGQNGQGGLLGGLTNRLGQ